MDTALFDTAALRRSMEERDTAALLALYADDAVLEVVDRERQPSKPRTVEGRAAIGEYFADVCGRDMTHKVDRVLVDADQRQAAYLETCTYPDGARVRCAAILDLAGGRIVRQSGVQAWDE